jgi:hypothetical protein
MIKINLDLHTPSKDLIDCSLAYHTFSPVKENRINIPMLRLLTLINNDLNYVINNERYYSSIIKKLILNQKLTPSERKLMKITHKVINSKIDYNLNKKLSDIYFNKYKNEILPKLIEIFDSLFSKVVINLYVYFTDDPFMGGSGGSATYIGFYLSLSKFYLDNNNHNFSKIFSIFTHELIHSVNNNSKEYLSIKQKLNKDDIHLFSEILTSTVENICMYKLGYNDCKYLNYRYDLDKSACKIEDRMRRVYDSWEISKSKSKGKFIEYLNKNIKKIL